MKPFKVLRAINESGLNILIKLIIIAPFLVVLTMGWGILYLIPILLHVSLFFIVLRMFELILYGLLKNRDSLELNGLMKKDLFFLIPIIGFLYLSITTPDSITRMLQVYSLF